MEKIYFIGINGIGMSGLAKILKLKGKEVFGSDISRSYVTEELEALGVKVHDRQIAENIKEIDTVVISTAIKEMNPELQEAKRLGIKVMKRGELLAFLMNAEKGIAVAGTHGKTTTSSMLSSVLLDKDPTVIVGGIVPEISSNAKIGKGELFIVEADESDNSFLHLYPEISIVTNIESDHLEHHGNLDNIIKSFEKFLNQTKSERLLCVDCPTIRRLIRDKKNIKTYSLIDEKADIYAKEIRIDDGKTKFTIVIDGEIFGEFELSIPGNHNVQNALPVVYLGKRFGISRERIADRLKNFKGAKRRYDILFDRNIRIIDDYAHHPTEIKATLQGAKSIEKNRIITIFQPHRYSRVNFLLNEFKDSFKDSDEVVLLPIYSAGEQNIFGVTLEELKERINHPKIKILNELEKLESIVNLEEKGVTYIFMGAGNISNVAHRIAEKLKGEI